MPQRLLITLVKAYRLLLSPSLGSGCRFEPTCSAYSLQALQQHGAAAGTYLTLGRLVRCHPWCDGGLDPVAAQFSFFPSSWFSVGRAANKDNCTRRLFSRLVTPVAASPSKKKPS
ncbi:MAG: membrane protein insertion efficiency factor YidD [Polaromonas sp.]|nr:membrane protein insertion efficiency factor YidD [Polaromonas sp.]